MCLSPLFTPPSQTVLAVIVGPPASPDNLHSTARALLERFTLEDWASAAPLIVAAQERERAQAVAGISPDLARRSGEALARFLRDRHERDPAARAVIDQALAMRTKG